MTLGDIVDRAGLAAALGSLASLGLPDAWIGAGALRNPAWDALSGFAPGSNPPEDIDVVWFDPARATPEADAAIEARLHALHPGLPWSVHNQARMAARNGDAPYVSTLDAIAHWPETATAIAARWTANGVETIAPPGTADLLGLILRPTSPSKVAAMAARAAAKGWTRRWPRLTMAPINRSHP
ncbi:nucleotidyltransferase family protein [Belnapia sp. F-4-1]|uniref:nucleotidyltransferase family protein n=1 Tax=Belnapia sp. F-4-1 TaxID=1545443 RepID=UPI00191781AD|nr:nucleotidyltransferase family protein [Belnapia sp. F-4-1]